MVDRIKDNIQEKVLFQGSIRDLRPGDIFHLRPILSTWIKDRNTGDPLPSEVEEDLQIMVDSTKGFIDCTYIVAEDEDGEIIGVIGFRNPNKRMMEFAKTDKPAELINAYVKANQRKGRGVGTALVKALEQKALDRGYKEIILNSGPRYKDTGWGFYDQLDGYKRVGIAKNYYDKGGDAPVWQKEL